MPVVRRYVRFQVTTTPSCWIMALWIAIVWAIVVTLKQQTSILHQFGISLDDVLYEPSSFFFFDGSSSHNGVSVSDVLNDPYLLHTLRAYSSSFRQDYFPRSNTTTVDVFVKKSMSRELSWYKMCMKNNATRRVSAVPRACPPSNDIIDRDAAINNNPLQDRQCSVTETIELELLQDDTSSSKRWVLKTLDGFGNYKTMGGDEFYFVTFSVYNNSTTTITQQPLRLSRTIKTDQTSLSSHLGRLEIFLQYTCFMGTLHQPLKDGWKSGGGSNIRTTLENVPCPPMQSWKERLHERGGVIRNPSYIVSNNTKPNITSLSRFDTTIFFGDSLMAQMVMTYSYPVSYFHYPKAVTHGNADITVSTGTVQSVNKKLEEWEGAQLRRKSNIALVLGSASWDMLLPLEWQGSTFDRHLQGCRDLIHHVRKTYPHVTIVWRLPTAVHVHNANRTCFMLEEGQIQTTTPKGKTNWDKPRNPCADILRYASTSRIDYLYRQQLHIMLHELHVPVIDLYEISFLSAHHLQNGDAQHYSIDWNFINLKEFLYPDEKDKIRMTPVESTEKGLTPQKRQF
ncbi:hypothetical protein IV203_018735 [Nitzschia inconspicua]|uniref:Uncharacterized protein n=1 Tax=Nitzschia inconspicua TaxID=303405 RepID=A0A9K3M2D7_9STRA|nr:hypothetical protein IV203_018735 [Nitzschia inconspicua]